LVSNPSVVAFHAQVFASLCPFFVSRSADHRDLHSFPTRRSSDLAFGAPGYIVEGAVIEKVSSSSGNGDIYRLYYSGSANDACSRSEEHTSELQSRENLVCRLLLEKKKSIYRCMMGRYISDL